MESHSAKSKISLLLGFYDLVSFVECDFLTLSGHISIVEMVFQIQDVNFLRIIICSSRSANQHDLWLVIDMERGMLWI